MFPANFPASNGVLDKPPGMEECDPLCVWRGVDANQNLPVVVSCWKPTKEELEEINRTGRIWLYIYGYTMQPAAIGGHDPFKEAS